MESLSNHQIEQATQWRLGSVKNNTAYTLHHTLPQSQAWQGLDVFDSRGHIQIEDDLHQKWHHLFHNMMPHQQLIMRLAINRSSLSDQVKDTLLSIKVDDFYKKELRK